jgi:hypothetical protein
MAAAAKAAKAAAAAANALGPPAPAPPKTTFKLKVAPRAAAAPPPPLPPPRPPPPERTPAQQAAVDAALAAALAPAPPPPPAAAPPAAAQAWTQLLPGAAPPAPLAPRTARDQVMRDLHHLFCAVLKVYAPQVAQAAAAAAAAAAGEPPPPPRLLRLKRLAEQVQVLRDAKHFVSVCLGETPWLGPQPAEGELRVWVQLATPEELSPPPLATRCALPPLPCPPFPLAAVADPRAARRCWRVAAAQRARYVFLAASATETPMLPRA